MPAQICARPQQLHRNQRLLLGLGQMWPGTGKCRLCLGTHKLVVCQGTDCPWTGDYATCSICRAESWQKGVCEACCAQAHIATVAAAATVEAGALFDEQRPPQLVPAQVQPSACAEVGWVLYTARRILKKEHAGKLKGLHAIGPTPADVPIGAVVVDAETGKFVGARVRAVMGSNLRALRTDVAADAAPSKPCGAKAGPVRIVDFVQDRSEKLDGVSTLASLRITVPSPTAKAFWTLGGVLPILSPPFCMRTCLSLHH